MDLAHLNDRGLLLVGCGSMGGALLRGWLARGLAPHAAHVIDPDPPGWLDARGVPVNGPMPADPAVLVLAVKPQQMGGVLPELAALGQGGTLVVSVAAGVTLDAYERVFPNAPIVRAMPNLPAAVGQGVTAIVGNARAGAAEMDMADSLMAAVGRVVRLEDESQMDAVTAVSGSGPGFVFHMVEALAAAGEAEGLSPALALDLARATVAGAGAMMAVDGADPARLRESVTSPGGTTAAGLAHLMDPETGLVPLMRRTVGAAAAQARRLGQ